MATKKGENYLESSHNNSCTNKYVGYSGLEAQENLREMLEAEGHNKFLAWWTLGFVALALFMALCFSLGGLNG